MNPDAAFVHDELTISKTKPVLCKIETLTPSTQFSDFPIEGASSAAGH